MRHFTRFDASVKQLLERIKGANLMNAKRVLAAMIICAAAVTIAAAQRGDGSFQPQAKKPDLTGAWLVDVTPQGQGAPPPFKALASFHSDGTLVETESDTLIPPFITPGHGVWEKVRNGVFAFKILFLTFDGQGNFTGTAKVHGTIFIDGGSPDQYTSPATVEFFDADGNFLFGGDASGTARRIKLDAVN